MTQFYVTLFWPIFTNYCFFKFYFLLQSVFLGGLYTKNDIKLKHNLKHTNKFWLPSLPLSTPFGPSSVKGSRTIALHGSAHHFDSPNRLLIIRPSLMKHLAFLWSPAWRHMRAKDSVESSISPSFSHTDSSPLSVPARNSAHHSDIKHCSQIQATVPIITIIMNFNRRNRRCS